MQIPNHFREFNCCPDCPSNEGGINTCLFLERCFRTPTKRELLFWIYFVFNFSEKGALNELITEDGILFLNAVM